MQRIDSLTPGTKVILVLEPDSTEGELATFVRMEGAGDERRATFETPAQEGLTQFPAYEWDAYRFQGRWCYGSSADTLRLVRLAD